MEQHMQDFLTEIGGLCIEEQHDAHIANAIWGETSPYRKTSLHQAAHGDSQQQREGSSERSSSRLRALGYQ